MPHRTAPRLFRLALLAGLVGLASVAAARPKGATLDGIPDGPYQKSCTQCRVQSGEPSRTLSCSCKNTQQKAQDTTLRLPCKGTINNCDGSLRCGPC